MPEKLIQLDENGKKKAQDLHGIIERMKKDDTLPSGIDHGAGNENEGQIIFNKGGDSEMHHWTTTGGNDNPRLLRHRLVIDGSPYADTTVDIDSGKQMPTSYDVPPTR